MQAKHSLTVISRSDYKEEIFLRTLFSALEHTVYKDVSLGTLRHIISKVWGPGFLAHQSFARSPHDWIFIFEKRLPSLEILAAQGFFEDLTPKEVLFECFMTDFDHMKSYGTGYLQFLRHLFSMAGIKTTVELLDKFRSVLMRRMESFLRISEGERRISFHERIALSLIYTKSLYVYSKDVTLEMNQVMAFVNEGLSLLGSHYKNRFQGFECE